MNLMLFNSELVAHVQPSREWIDAANSDYWQSS